MSAEKSGILDVVKTAEADVGVLVKDSMEAGREITETAGALKIVDDPGYLEAGENVKMIRDTLRELEKNRKEMVGPINQGVKAINQGFKAVVDPLMRAEQVIRDKMGAYSTAKAAREKAAREAKEKKALEDAARLEELGAKKEAEEVLAAAVEPVAPPAKTVKGAGATVTSRKIFDNVVVVDIAKVPLEFLTVSASLVRVAYQNGAREIPGLKIIERVSTTVR